MGSGMLLSVYTLCIAYTECDNCCVYDHFMHFECFEFFLLYQKYAFTFSVHDFFFFAKSRNSEFLS